jgi:ribulose-5-phosphate 4-epimerase/fuculose-1-phosphate aldolase
VLESATGTAGGAIDEALLGTGRAMVARGLVIGSVGNASAHTGEHVRITPTRLAYDAMRPADLVTVDLEGRTVAGERRPSRELALHLAIYRARADAGAILHTHSRYATAWSFLGVPLEPELEDLAYHAVGRVRVADVAPAGSALLGESAVRALEGSRAALLGRHGVVVLGGTLQEALTIAELVEHQAHIAWLLRSDAARTSAALPA